MAIIHPSTRHFLEYLPQLGFGGNLRDTQVSVEAINATTGQGLRDTQVSTEAAVWGDVRNILDTQVSVEPLVWGNVRNVFDTQVSVEPLMQAHALIGAPTCINFEIQTASQLLDEGQLAVIRRIFIDANLAGESLVPIALTDNAEDTLATITNSARGTIELAFQKSARQFSLRLTGCLSNRIEVFGIELDCSPSRGEG